MEGLQASRQHWRAGFFPELEDGPARVTTSRPNPLFERRVCLGEEYGLYRAATNCAPLVAFSISEATAPGCDT